MTDILNYGALNLAIGIGYNHKIFDIMESLDKPFTVKELSDKSGLNFRYLREWLGVMVTGGILELQQGKNPEEKDRYWTWGIFYKNPSDPRFLVGKRSGWGWTFNVAHPGMVALLLFVVFAILLFVVLWSFFIVFLV